MENYEFEVLELTGKLLKATFSARVLSGFSEMLTLAELFTSKRAPALPEKLHAMWRALCVLEPEQAVITGDTYRLFFRPGESPEAYMQRRMDAANAGY